MILGDGTDGQWNDVFGNKKVYKKRHKLFRLLLYLR